MPNVTQHLILIANKCKVFILLCLPVAQLALGMLHWTNVDGTPDGPMVGDDPKNLVLAKVTYVLALFIAIITSLFAIGLFILESWNTLRKVEYVHLVANLLQFLSIAAMFHSWNSTTTVGMLAALLVVAEMVAHANWLTTFPASNNNQVEQDAQQLTAV